MRVQGHQIDTLGTTEAERFEGRMVHHVDTFFRGAIWLLGEPQIRDAIRLGLQRAGRYGIEFQRDACLYISLMFVLVLGSHFDEDPLHPWAHEILTEDTFSSPKLRVDTLYDRAMVYLDRVLGRKNQHIMRAAARFLAETPEALFTPHGSGELPPRLRERLQQVYPEKYAAHGEAELDALIADGITRASSIGLQDERNIVTYVCAMFVFGHRFDVDPKLANLTQGLRDPAADEGARMGALYERARDLIEKATVRAAAQGSD
ncbi:hypothetical protein [Chondromyces crocatus]|uniref:Uncharacterized protein n=1 Tax=Chondromyces crocatus TaxID=52 RepID=A0A0K1EPS3_CHOCO|nr:hypothetical protein [Chondromyces crocatus]AKT42608.1 uncharacterized protein CMC5_068350 [Chondromyces crocatus]